MKEVEYIGDKNERICIANLLARYSWQPYNFKSRSWERLPRRRSSRRTGEQYKWVVSRNTPLHLAASANRKQSVSEVVTPLEHRPVGIVLFAGDPLLIGVCRDVRDRKNRIWFTHSTALSRETALRIGLSLTATSPLPTPPEPYFGEIMWVADQHLDRGGHEWEWRKAKERCRKLGFSA